MNRTASPFHVLAKPAGAACNLDCSYCFFLSKQSLYPNARPAMSDEVLEAYIRQRLDTAEPQIEIAWQGGEPTLMGLDFYKRAMALVAEHRRPGQQVVNVIQTNGLLLDDEWCVFLKENQFLVGLSIDGPGDLHDAYRVDKRGGGSFHLVMRAWRTLRKHAVDTNVLCTLNARNAGCPLEVYRFFRDELEAGFIQFIPIVERATAETLPIANRGWRERPGGPRIAYLQRGNLVSQRSVSAQQFGEFLVQVFDEWVARDVGRVFVQTFDAALASWMGRPSLCLFAPTCGRALALEHNGDLYSCDHYVERQHLLGNIRKTPLHDLVGSPAQHKFGQAKQASLPRHCRDCEVLFACHGECPRNRFIRSPSGEPGLNYLCAGYKRFFGHIDSPMKAMADLLCQGRFADEIMRGPCQPEP